MHLWLSPQIALESAIVIHDMLLKSMPQKKITIDKNLKYFKLCLSKINKDIKKMYYLSKKKNILPLITPINILKNFMDCIHQDN